MSRPLELLYEDEHLLVVDKPAGLLSVPTPNAQGRTVLDVLREQGREALAVHRIDRDVSGALLCARSEAMRAALDAAFRERTVRKVYWALAQGELQREQGEYKDPILDEGSFARVSARGKPSATRWNVLARRARATEVEIELLTGRYNQIRLHFAHHGHPLVGERKYARGKDDPLGGKRVALHAWKLELAHPVGGRLVQVEAPLPRDLVELAQRAGPARARG
jgi:23S rRNA pseudouridine1911/1915/1917 synthase